MWKFILAISQKLRVNRVVSNIVVIQCRLIATGETLCYLWKLMAEKYTPFVNEILQQISTHPNFDTWLKNGTLPSNFVETLADNLKTQPQFQGMPGRFITSASTLVNDMYASWFAVKERKQRSLNGKKRFLSILKSDEELEIESSYTLDILRTEARKILKSTQENIEEKWQEQLNAEKAQKELFHVLFDAYDKAKKPLQRCAIAFLLKNNCKVREDPEDTKKYQKHRKQKEIQIRRLEEQLQASTPKGRIIDNSEWLDVLSQAKTPLLTVEEFNAFQARLLQKYTHLPFPVFYETNTDLTWLKNEQGRICVKFNGLSQFIFEIACDRRQLHWFERFLSDYKTYQQHKTKVPTGLMPLRSAHLVWKEGKTKGEEWNIHHLHLHCAVDHRLWTTQGTETVKVEKIAKTQNLINSFQLKEQEAGLNLNQRQRLKANQTSLTLLQTFDGFSLSCRSNYQGQPEIFVGVSMGLENPATLAVVNIKTGEVLTYRSTKQLLSKIRRVRDKKPLPKKGKATENVVQNYKEISDYELLLLHRQQKQQNKHHRHIAQINSTPNTFGESNLGLYINRLLAKAIIEVAQQYHASTIVLPDLKNQREIIESEIRAKAELKIPGNKEAQDQYAKTYRASVHEWSYKQLTDCIHTNASKVGITVETIRQTTQGNSHSQAASLVFSFCMSYQKL